MPTIAPGGRGPPPVPSSGVGSLGVPLGEADTAGNEEGRREVGAIVGVPEGTVGFGLGATGRLEVGAIVGVLDRTVGFELGAAVVGLSLGEGLGKLDGDIAG
jgi:hypothetical protein